MFVDWYYQFYETKLPDNMWEFSKVVWTEAYEKGRAKGREEGVLSTYELENANRHFKEIIKCSKAGLRAIGKVVHD